MRTRRTLSCVRATSPDNAPSDSKTAEAISVTLALLTTCLRISTGRASGTLAKAVAEQVDALLRPRFPRPAYDLGRHQNVQSRAKLSYCNLIVDLDQNWTRAHEILHNVKQQRFAFPVGRLRIRRATVCDPGFAIPPGK
jgi:hypothetical protein